MENRAADVYDAAGGPGARYGRDVASLAQGAVSARNTFTVRIPMQIRKRGGRKLILAPDGGEPIWAAPRPRVDNTIIKAVARAFRWRKLNETGVHASIEELARAEKINRPM